MHENGRTQDINGRMFTSLSHKSPIYSSYEQWIFQQETQCKNTFKHGHFITTQYSAVNNVPETYKSFRFIDVHEFLIILSLALKSSK